MPRWQGLVLEKTDKSKSLPASDPIYFSILNTLLKNKISPSCLRLPGWQTTRNDVFPCSPSVHIYPASHRSFYWCFLAILRSTYPGPAGRPADYFSCGYCQLDVSWGCNNGVACDTCEVWYHISCHEINMSRYQRMQDPEVNWKCYKCSSAFSDTLRWQGPEL